MATASIGGLASGLDTATIIEQLMALEALPQTKLKTQVSNEESKVASLQKLNTALATLASSAKSLAEADRTSGTWGTLTTTSSTTAVSATAGTAAAAGTLTVTVDAVATAAVGRLSGTALTPGATFTINQHDGTPFLDADGQPVTVTLDGDPTYSELATAINATGSTTGLQAVVVHGSAGDVLQVRSTETGAESDFSITDGTTTLAGSGGTDARITVDGVAITSASNTFRGVVDGVDVTIAPGTAAGTEATVTMARDAASRSSAVQGLVDAVNSVLTMLGTQTSSGSGGAGAGLLAGDSAARQVGQSLVNAIWPGGNASLAAYGVELDRYGKYTFDSEKFAAAYAADPDAVTAAFVGETGLAQRIEDAAVGASDRFDGYITSAISGRNATIDRLNDNIERWDDRLALRRTTLERTYTALETALSSLNAQSSWLTSQLASLSSSSDS